MSCLKIKKILIIVLFNILIHICINAIKIKVGKNFQNYICKEWEQEIENCHIMEVDQREYDDTIRISGKEDLFLLLESKTNINDNKIEFYDYCVNGFFPTNVPSIDGTEEIIKRTFIVDFSNDLCPQYKLKFEKIQNNKQPIGLFFENNNQFLEEEVNKYLVDEIDPQLKQKMGEEYDKFVNDRKKVISQILKNLNTGNFIEKSGKWALFEIKLTGIDKRLYFYCNDIESKDGMNRENGEFRSYICGIFDYCIEEIKVIKSNVSNVSDISAFFPSKDALKKVDLSNFKFKKPVSMQFLFSSPTLEHFILPNSKMYFNNIRGLFSGSQEKLKIENLDKLEGAEKLYDISKCFDNSKIKKIKFSKCKIMKYTRFSDLGGNKGFLINNNLESIDLSNITFEKDAGKGMFANNKIKEIILPETIRTLEVENLMDIFIDSEIENIKIGCYELNNITKSDKIHFFVKNPKEYLKNRNIIQKNENKDVLPEILYKGIDKLIDINVDETIGKDKNMDVKKIDLDNKYKNIKKEGKEYHLLGNSSSNCCCLNCSCKN